MKSWYVETTVRGEDGKLVRQWIDVAPIVGPILGRLIEHGGGQTIGLLAGYVDYENKADYERIFRSLYPIGSESPPETTLLTVRWTTRERTHERKKIQLIKAVRDWAGLDLLGAKELADKLDYGDGVFYLAPTPTPLPNRRIFASREALAEEIRLCGATLS